MPQFGNRLHTGPHPAKAVATSGSPLTLGFERCFAEMAICCAL